MRVIDLLNKIANGERPKNILYKDKLYYWDKNVGNYIFNEDENVSINWDYVAMYSLDNEVETINNEKWKTIVEFPNYEISTNGEVRTKEYYDSRNHLRKSKLLEKQVNNVGYEYVILSNDTEKHKTLTVHRLVAKTFFDDYCDNLEVNHINGIKTDNRIENLEMTTHCENIKKRYEIGNDGNNYKEVEQYDLDGNYIKTYKSSYEAEKMTGVSRTCIGGCCRNEHHTAGGYIWKFKSKIEEDKKISKLDFVEENTFSKRQNGMTSEDRRLLDSNFRELGTKINEIIDKLNEMEKE